VSPAVDKNSGAAAIGAVGKVMSPENKSGAVSTFRHNAAVGLLAFRADVDFL
jgi:hypothetical protein